jgi:trehalose 6-phosphate phosphatase
VSNDDDVAVALELCRATLSDRPSGLLTDIDGTISLIAPTPEAASVGDEAKKALVRLSALLDVVGVVTGRSAPDAESMVGVPAMLYVGNHGLEARINGATTVNSDAAAVSGEIAAALAEVELVASCNGIQDGIIYENKGVTGSIHYRLAPDQEAAHRELLRLVVAEASARGLKVTEGRMVIELRPKLAINKGTAITRVVEQSGLKGVVFLGDDVTDTDGFRAVTKLRDVGLISGTNVAVVAPETDPMVAEAADVAIHGVESCVRLLSALADSFEGLHGV